jgi:hypothetical protein
MSGKKHTKESFKEAVEKRSKENQARRDAEAKAERMKKKSAK